LGKHTERHDLLEVGKVVLQGRTPWEALLDAWQPSLREHEGSHEAEMRSVSANIQIVARNLWKGSLVFRVWVGNPQKTPQNRTLIDSKTWVVHARQT
jgi:hypothetical protein